MKRMLSVFGIAAAIAMCLAFPAAASDDVRLIKPSPIEIVDAAPTLPSDTLTVAVCSLPAPLHVPKRQVVASGYGDTVMGLTGRTAGSASLPPLHRPHEDPGRMPG